ncbi:tRNA pseudouridine(54/55) synthase Pus10 [Candidatus Methanocrinis natronophilus]|uniref:tRNA pseudouridine synthase Pus10 n=1 Tax=Candidatus Methanocrinis natronophilus TaxID=3033396 RepID=A0ABT5X4T2_9EURY|nr:tRNA pseudouridine(54/55) synthase Pus10 [Candidatus Methanocrinis natronophilus]MDF0589710.1 tRNA pseudouridine(54/55) synthase Pus10 [Candidatus Methanocrinis natronophilus]
MKTDDMDKEVASLGDAARRILGLGPICDSCLGRQFAILSTGLTNAQRGKSIKTFLSMAGSLDESGRDLLTLLARSSRNARLKLGMEGEPDSCWVCLGEMEPERLDQWAEAAVRELRHLEHETFLVGTKMSGLLAENEELILADGGSIHAEPMKSELNREVGKRIAERTGKATSFTSPEVLAILNLEDGRVDVQVASLYIRGRYRKLARGFPQTRWPCRDCGGSGCESCGFSGRRYRESVDELIRDPIIEAARCEDTVFHGSGREDIDARMLGTGRPFVVEAVSPRVRTVDLARLREDINRRAGGKVEVDDLEFTEKATVEELKKALFEKTYNILLEFEGEVAEEKLKSVLDKLVGLVEQRTPTRVSHRRADKVRKREVLDLRLDQFSGKAAWITLRGTSGLYVKELVSGDGGRTRPSLAGLLGSGARVVELDVTNVGGEAYAQITRCKKTD